MEIDQPVASGSASDVSLRQKVVIAEKALLESGDNRTLARRSRKDALQVLCQDRHLDDVGDKIELASRLINWVRTVSSAVQERTMI